MTPGVVLVSLLLLWAYFTPCSSVSIVNFEHVISGLGVTIDNKLTFKSHIKNLCKKASQKIGALSTLSNQLNDFQKRLILNSIVKSHFTYCPLVLMICSITSNNMIAKYMRGHWEWYLMTVKVILSYCQIILTFVTTIENWIEILKIKKGFAPPIMGSILIERNNTCNVRNFQKNLR